MRDELEMELKYQRGKKVIAIESYAINSYKIIFQTDQIAIKKQI